jgi:glutathione synthase/RimK-type ligase-like ATP-grasp enzyme
MILVVSNPQDTHAAYVLEQLREMGEPACLLDLSHFPGGLRLTADIDGSAFASRLTLESGKVVNLMDVRSIWWRRPQPVTIPPVVRRDSHRGFAHQESVEALAGLWQAVDVYWMNHPTRDEVAGRKLNQLKVARACGMRVPRTCITNDPAAAHAFIEREGMGRVICKAFSATYSEWRETRLVSAAEVSHLASVSVAPVIFQEYIEADVDLRITIVGDQVFPAAIKSQRSRYKVDFRMDMTPVEIVEDRLPSDVVAGLRALMEHYGLQYGAIDMRRTPAGEHVFLEINPAGQFLFIEEKTGQPIARTVASTLARRPAVSATSQVPDGVSIPTV